MENNNKVYDGILSLGCWCQVGTMMWKYSLREIFSPLDNYGIREWQRLMDLLESRFSDYWELENIRIAEPDTYFSVKHREMRSIYRIRDYKYNLTASHYCDVDENTKADGTPDFITYPEFREKRDILAEIFLSQCEIYDTVLFVCKVMGHPDKPTIINRDDIPRLCRILSELRLNKPFDLKLTIPAHLYEEVSAWINEDGLHHVSLFPWVNPMNNDDEKDEEWVWMYGDVQLSDDYLPRLNADIIGIADPESSHLYYLNR